jgi:hypothetical protein
MVQGFRVDSLRSGNTKIKGFKDLNIITFKTYLENLMRYVKA